MKIAITSQHRCENTEHAGRCRKFWFDDSEQQQIRAKTLRGLPKEQSFHESSPQAPHPLDEVAVLISRRACEGVWQRMAFSVLSPKSMSVMRRLLLGLQENELPNPQIMAAITINGTPFSPTISR